MPRLHVILPDGSDATHELTEELISIGRVSDNAIQIEDASVSSHHAELRRNGEDYALIDIGSTNGTRLNNEAVAENDEKRLRHGDSILFGSVTVHFLTRVGSEAQPLPTGVEPDLAAATTSIAPVDFANASPFKKKGSQREGAAMGVYALGILAILAAGGAVYLVTTLTAPL